MGLKKKTGELVHRIEDRSVVAHTLRRLSRMPILSILKERQIEVLYLTVLFLFSAGLVNGLIEGASPTTQNFLIFPQRGLQTFPETFIYLFTMLIGSAGVYLLYLGGRQTLRRRISDFYIMLGFSGILTALAFTLYIFAVKG